MNRMENVMANYGRIASEVQRLEQGFAQLSQAMAQLIELFESEAREAGMLVPNGLDTWKALHRKIVSDTYGARAGHSS